MTLYIEIFLWGLKSEVVDGGRAGGDEGALSTPMSFQSPYGNQDKLQATSHSGKKPPKYDYYNPSTWLVQQEEEAALTDDIFAKLNAQNEKLDAEDREKARLAEEEATELANAEENKGNSRLYGSNRLHSQLTNASALPEGHNENFPR